MPQEEPRASPPMKYRMAPSVEQTTSQCCRIVLEPEPPCSPHSPARQALPPLRLRGRIAAYRLGTLRREVANLQASGPASEHLRRSGCSADNLWLPAHRRERPPRTRVSIPRSHRPQFRKSMLERLCVPAVVMPPVLASGRASREHRMKLMPQARSAASSERPRYWLRPQNQPQSNRAAGCRTLRFAESASAHRNPNVVSMNQNNVLVRGTWLKL